MHAVLTGIRVIDFGRYIAGPYCAALLADLGADVIRVERREGGEDRWISRVSEDGSGALYLACNRNKRGMTLDPAQPGAKEIIRRLVRSADVIIANLPPEVLHGLGLDYPSLCQIKPDIILTTVTAFGGGGPWSHKTGFDGIGQAMCGSQYLSGTPEQPMRAAVPWVDSGTASLAAFGTVAALMARQQTGQGQHVEGALLRTAVAFNNSALIEQQLVAPNRVATANRGYVAAPADSFRTSDGWIVAYAIGQPMFKRWARMIGEDTWTDDPRFANDQRRVEHADLISARMNAWTSSRTTEDALAALDKAAIPAAPLLSPQQALEHPHIQAAGMLGAMEYPGIPQPAPVAPTPISLSASPGTLRLRAPTLGEHTDEILAELGFGFAEIQDLRVTMVV